VFALAGWANVLIMPGFRDHPLDAVLESMVQSLTNADAQLGHMSANVRDFDSVVLSPEEDTLLFHNPALRHTGQVHPQTGLPYTNAQAAQQLLKEIGPDEYVKYVHDFVNRAERRGRGEAEPFIPEPDPMAAPAPMPAPMPEMPPPPDAMMPPPAGGPPLG
jgi:hypothetical protein